MSAGAGGGIADEGDGDRAVLAIIGDHLAACEIQGHEARKSDALQERCAKALEIAMESGVDLGGQFVKVIQSLVDFNYRHPQLNNCAPK